MLKGYLITLLDAVMGQYIAGGPPRTTNAHAGEARRRFSQKCDEENPKQANGARRSTFAVRDSQSETE
jgi:hypothetical protein